MSSNMPKPTIDDDSPDEILNVTDPDDDQYAVPQRGAKRHRGMDISVDMGLKEEPKMMATPKVSRPIMAERKPHFGRPPAYAIDVPRVPDDDDIEVDIGMDIDMRHSRLTLTSDEDIEEDEDVSGYGAENSLTDDDNDVVPPNSLLSDIPPSENVRVEVQCPVSVLYGQNEFDESLAANTPLVEVVFKLTNMRQFRRMPENTHFYSSFGFVRGIPFRIMILNRDIGPLRQTNSGAVGNRYIGFFVQCNPDIKIKWNLRGIVFLKMLSHDPEREDYTRRIVHTFHPGENDWGYAQYYACENFDDSSNPYLHNDTITFKVQIYADPPKFPVYVNPLFNQFFADRCGLKNLGSTCYFNSLLQMLFSIRKLRRIVYGFNSIGESDAKRFMMELQYTFYKMQYSDHSVDPSSLGKMLWNDTYTQEDVHDMFMKLIDRVETAMRPDECVKEMFQSRLQRLIKCLNVNHTKNLSTEELNCVLLSVRQGNKAFGSLRESLISYTAGSRLEGENCYKSEEYGLQVADMCSRFVNLPPILVVTLQRSTYDNYAVKINDRFEYEDVMNLEEFLDDDTKHAVKHASYKLNSVIVHYGESGCGHYVSYVNTHMKGPSRWVKCDDELVYRVMSWEAIANNYGIAEGAKEQDSGTAYVLTYLRQDVIDDMMGVATEDDILPEVRDVITKRFDDEERSLKEKVEQSFCQTLYVVNDDVLKSLKYSRFDLLDFKDPDLTKDLPKMILPKDMFIGNIYEELRMHCDFLTDKNFKIYLFRHSEIPYVSADMKLVFKGGMRPCYPLSPEIIHQAQMLGDGLVQSAIYVRIVDEAIKLEECHEPTIGMLVFVKVFDQGELYFAGSLMIQSHDAIADLIPEFKRVAGFPDEMAVRVYSEVSPYDVRELEDDDVANPHNGFNGDGSIVVIEKISEDRNEQSFHLFWLELSRSVTLHVEKNDDLFPLNSLKEPSNSQTIECHVDTKLLTIAEELLENHPGIDKSQVLIWRSGPSFDKPSYIFYEHMNNSTVADLLGTKPDAYDGREKFQFELKYTVFTFKIEKQCDYPHQTVYAFGSRFKHNQYDVLLCSNTSVGQALEDASTALDLPPNEVSTGKIRLVATYRAGQDKAYIGAVSRAFKVIDPTTRCPELLKLVNDTKCALRIEEIPHDQATLEEGEFLIPITHFEQSIAQVFGLSIFLKMKKGEKFGTFKPRLRELLSATEEEFSTYKFFIFEGALCRGPINDETIVREEWTANDYHFMEHPVLSIQHSASPEYPKISINM